VTDVELTLAINCVRSFLDKCYHCSTTVILLTRQGKYRVQGQLALAATNAEGKAAAKNGPRLYVTSRRYAWNVTCGPTDSADQQ